jgi:hypothetical protein
MILWLNGWLSEPENGCTCGERMKSHGSRGYETIGIVVYKGCKVHAQEMRRYARNPDECDCTVVVDKDLGFSRPVYEGWKNCNVHRNMSAYSPTKRCTCLWGYQNHGPGLDEPIIEELDPFCFEHSHYPFDRAYMK